VNETQAVRAILSAVETSLPTRLDSRSLEGKELQDDCGSGRDTQRSAMLEPRTPEANTTRSPYISSPNGSATPRTAHQPTTSVRPLPRSPIGTKTPPRQDSSYFSNPEHSDDDSSMAAPNSGVRKTRRRHEISLLRGRVLRTRRKVRDRRAKLTLLRENFRNAVDILMRRVNETVAFNSVREQLGPDHDKLRDAQDALGLAESEYDDLERKLEQEERQLDNEEYYFYDAAAPSSPSSSSEVGDNIIPFLGHENARETESPSPNLEYDAVQEYLRKMTEAHYAREDLDALEEDYFRFSSDMSFRDRHDVWFSDEAKSFLADYPKRRVEIEQSLQKTEAELVLLRAECLSNGLFAEDEHVYQPHDALIEDVMDSIYDAEERSPLRLASIKFSNHGETFEGDDRKEHDLVNYEDKRTFVNHWLLEWIQDSTYECSLLKSWIYSTCLDQLGTDKGLENNHWSELALKYWDNDAAGAHAEAFNSASMLDVIPGETRRVNASIGITDFSGSWRSSDIDLDDIADLQERVASGDNVSSPFNGSPPSSEDEILGRSATLQ
jgi:hypothetical protein